MKKIFRKVALWFSTFIIFYLLTVLGFWLTNNWQNISSRQTLLTNYTQTQNKLLRENVFNIIFAKGEECNNILIDKQKIACRQTVSHLLATSIQEESLKYSSQDWPSDLFFVKQEDDRFLELNWSGQVKDISNEVNNRLIASKFSFFFSFLTKNCKFFHLGDNRTYCEIYTSLPLNNTETGYLVRIVPLAPKTQFNLILFSPIFAIEWLMFYLDTKVQFLSPVVVLIPLLSPAIVYLGLFIFRRYSHPSKKHQGK